MNELIKKNCECVCMNKRRGENEGVGEIKNPLRATAVSVFLFVPH